MNSEVFERFLKLVSIADNTDLIEPTKKVISKELSIKLKDIDSLETYELAYG